jgi:hypothetical protein
MVHQPIGSHDWMKQSDEGIGNDIGIDPIQECLLEILGKFQAIFAQNAS